MKVLITGGSGFIGSHLCDLLIDRGHQVIALDNYYTSHPRNIEHLRHHSRFQFIKQDVTDSLNMNDFVGVEQIYNLACPASPIHYQKNPIYTTQTCVLGTLNTLELARELKAKYLLASTSEVYGDPERYPQKEDHWGRVNTVGPRSCYKEGKRCAESITFDYYRMHNLPVKIARIFNTYGPRMNVNDGRAVPNFIVQALMRKPLTIYGDGQQTRSFCYVSDLVDGLAKLMNSNDSLMGPVNLGNPNEFSIKELASQVLEIISHSLRQFHHKNLPDDDPIKRKPHIRLAKEKLNWKPSIPLQQGLEKTIHYFEGIITSQTYQPSHVAVRQRTHPLFASSPLRAQKLWKADRTPKEENTI